jgi:NADH-quinone oxidoreductase subunit L
MNALLLIVPLAPLVAALSALLVGRRAPRAAGRLAVSGTAVALSALLALLGSRPRISTTWLQSADYTFTVGLRLDPLGLLPALLVAGVGLLITIYAVGYMAAEPGQARFFATFAGFIGAMLTLVLADSLLLLFVAWEGVGVASFLLIGFRYRQDEARRAAQQAFLLTRLGDLGLLLGWLWVLQAVGTTDIATFLQAVETDALPAAGLTLIALLFLSGAIGKSAQLPLTAWLPAAMAGPTPVSALIHSATMVAAGVYLLLRLFPLFAAVPLVLNLVFWVGGLTALFAALVATVQTDLKRILAWSTVSQLGEMLLALGLGGPLAAAYHLTTHALFKSTLFLAAGAVDHATDTRDLRHLGGLRRTMPMTTLIFGAAALALAGVPPFSGFWSEEAILAQAAARGVAPALLLLLLIFLAGVYISRAGVAVFARRPDAPEPAGHDPGWLLLGPMALLALGALGGGWLLAGRIEAFLAFPAEPEVALVWRMSAVAASLAGLALGALRVWRSGPVPTFGGLPRRLDQGLSRATALPANLAFYASSVADGIEAGFDRLVRGLGGTARRLAAGNERIEAGFDRVARGLGGTTRRLAAGNKRIEAGFDHAAATAAGVTLDLGHATETNETRGISATLDRFAGLFNRAGGRLRTLQSGRLYLYTLGLFLWVLLVGIVGGVVFWL